MRIDSAGLAALPEARGAYFLYHGRHLVFAGVAAGSTSVHDEVLAHLRGEFGAPTRAATHCSWRETASAEAAYGMQLDAHARRDLRKAGSSGR